jgi:hypothetical protein
VIFLSEVGASLRQNETMRSERAFSFQIKVLGYWSIPGRLALVFFAAMAAGLMSSCDSSTATRPNRFRSEDAEAQDRPLVDNQYRLAADRKAMGDLRKDIPLESQQKNDEIAFLMKLINDNPEREPAKIREDFDRALRKKRELLNKNFNKERDEFTKQERRTRDEFLKNQAEERKDFLKGKPAKDQRDRFFNDQDEKRKDFFANQREKRNDYESDTNERRRNFEDYAREKSNEFNSEYRIYSKKYEEMKKAKADAKSEAAAQRKSSVAAPAAPPVDPALLKEFDTIPKNPGDPLESGQ